MDTLDPFSFEFWIMIVSAICCGGIIGLEREIHRKPAGIRTSILVCLGTAIFLRLGILAGGGNADPTRVLGQVVTGIGFLGAGVMFTRNRSVKGVTTAAVIWVTAAIGAAVGLGQYPGALAISLVTVCLLVILELAEKHVLPSSRKILRDPHQIEDETADD